VKAKKQVDALWRQWAFDVETAVNAEAPHLVFPPMPAGVDWGV
jgi:hypothetical protein